MSGDIGLFFGQLLKHPAQVVALAPSSPALAAEMAAGLDPSGGPVIELGAGTGRITQAILARGLPAEQIHAIEMNRSFCDRLQRRFAGIHVHHGSATDTGALALEGVQAVISGLPLLSMPHEMQAAILGGSFRHLGARGSFVQFTYGPKPPVRAELRSSMGLIWTRSTKIWGNLPPARVYRFTRPEAGADGS